MSNQNKISGIRITELDGKPLASGNSLYWDKELKDAFTSESCFPQVETKLKTLEYGDNGYEATFTETKSSKTVKGVSCQNAESLAQGAKIPDCQIEVLEAAIEDMHKESEVHGVAEHKSKLLREFRLPNPRVMPQAWLVAGKFQKVALILWGFNNGSDSSVFLPLSETSKNWPDAKDRKSIRELLDKKYVGGSRFTFLAWFLIFLLILVLLFLICLGGIGAKKLLTTPEDGDIKTQATTPPLPPTTGGNSQGNDGTKPSGNNVIISSQDPQDDAGRGKGIQGVNQDNNSSTEHGGQKTAQSAEDKDEKIDKSEPGDTAKEEDNKTNESTSEVDGSNKDPSDNNEGTSKNIEQPEEGSKTEDPGSGDKTNESPINEGEQTPTETQAGEPKMNVEVPPIGLPEVSVIVKTRHKTVKPVHTLNTSIVEEGGKSYFVADVSGKKPSRINIDNEEKKLEPLPNGKWGVDCTDLTGTKSIVVYIDDTDSSGKNVPRYLSNTFSFEEEEKSEKRNPSHEKEKP